MKASKDFIRLRRVVAHKGDPARMRGLVVGYVAFNSRRIAKPCGRGNANGVKVLLWDGGVRVGEDAFGPRAACWRQEVCVAV